MKAERSKSMKKPWTFLLFLVLLVAGCEDQQKGTVESLNSLNVFALCEGNFNQSNASLWVFDPEDSTIQGPLYQTLTGNPLGDVGQSLTIDGEHLFVVNNNSHTIKVLQLGDEISVVKEISLPGASPRYLTVFNQKAYVTCWYLNGIIVLDLNTYSPVDTLKVNGMPERILEYGGSFYVSMKMNSDWSDGHQVLKLDPDGTLLATYDVIPGPGEMTIHNGFLYVASKYYDENWNSYAGTSRINLATGTVQTKDYGTTTEYGDDIFEFQNQVYRTFAGGVAPLNEDLTAAINEKIGDAPLLYSAAAYKDYLFFGLSDYEAPDEIQVLDVQGTLLQSYTTGAIPGAFAFFER
jgi:hypothetical protein